MSRRGRPRSAAFGLALLASAGCVTLSRPAPEVRSWRLDYPPPVPAAADALPAILRVAPLSTAATYDRLAIVFRDGRYRTGTYPADRWSATPGQMVADLIARDLAASGLYRAVQQGPSPVPSDYQLGGQIEEFEEREVAGACAARARIRFLLVRTASGPASPVVLQTTLEDDEPCTCGDARSLAAAMSRVLERIVGRLLPAMSAAVAADRQSAR